MLGKVYLLVTLGLLVLGLLWAAMTLRDNSAWVPVTLWLPAWTPEGPWRAQHYDVSASALLAGWFTTAGLMALYAIRAPFRIRAAANAQRRLRGLEREVLELRTLPLRQAEEDDMLAAEARLDVGHQRVMQGHYEVPGHARDIPGHSRHFPDPHFPDPHFPEQSSDRASAPGRIPDDADGLTEARSHAPGGRRFGSRP